MKSPIERPTQKDKQDFALRGEGNQIKIPQSETRTTHKIGVIGGVKRHD